jgi:hypothetical protein
MEHGLAKTPDFPHQPNHAPYAPFTLNPGLQGLLKFVGGLLLAIGLFTRTVAFCPRGRYGRSPISWCTRREMSSHCSTRGVGDRPLVRLPLFLGRRGRWMEPRSIARARIGIRRVAEPGLSTAIARKPRKLRFCRSPPGRPPAAGVQRGEAPPASCGIKTDFASPIDRMSSAWNAPTGRSLRTAPEPRSRRRLGCARWWVSYN